MSEHLDQSVWLAATAAAREGCDSLEQARNHCIAADVRTTQSKPDEALEQRDCALVCVGAAKAQFQIAASLGKVLVRNIGVTK